MKDTICCECLKYYRQATAPGKTQIMRSQYCSKRCEKRGERGGGTVKERKPNGWDERDYKLWGELMNLPSYGLAANNADNPMLARKDVIRLLEKAAEKRFDESHNRRIL